MKDNRSRVSLQQGAEYNTLSASALPLLDAKGSTSVDNCQELKQIVRVAVVVVDQYGPDKPHSEGHFYKISFSH